MFPIIIVILVAAAAVAALVIMKSLDKGKMYQDVAWAIIAVCFVSNVVLNVEYSAKHALITGKGINQHQQDREMGSLRER